MNTKRGIRSEPVLNRKGKYPSTLKTYLFSEPETALDDSLILALEAKVIQKSGHVSKIQCPVNAIDTIADTINSVIFVKLPDRLLPTSVQGEGVDLTGTAAYHSEGHFDSGI